MYNVRLNSYPPASIILQFYCDGNSLSVDYLGLILCSPRASLLHPLAMQSRHRRRASFAGRPPLLIVAEAYCY